MATSVVQFRVDEDLKNKFVEIYANLGLDLPSAMRMFMKRSVMIKGIPFGMVLPNLKYESEEALDYADRVAEEDITRYSHKEVFDKIRKKVNG